MLFTNFDSIFNIFMFVWDFEVYQNPNPITFIVLSRETSMRNIKHIIHTSLQWNCHIMPHVNHYSSTFVEVLTTTPSAHRIHLFIHWKEWRWTWNSSNRVVHYFCTLYFWVVVLLLLIEFNVTKLSMSLSTCKVLHFSIYQFYLITNITTMSIIDYK